MREQFRLCVCVYLEISPVKMRNSIAPGGFALNHVSQEPCMPFPINPLAMLANSLVLGILRGDPSVCLQGLKQTKSCADSM